MSKKADMQSHLRRELARKVTALSCKYAEDLSKGAEEGERETYLALCKIKQDMERDGKHKRKFKLFKK